MKSNQFLIFILIVMPQLCFAEGGVTNMSETQVSIDPASMSHLGITVNVSQQIEPREEFVEPDPNYVPSPQARPELSREERASFEESVALQERTTAETPANVNVNTGDKAAGTTKATTAHSPEPNNTKTDTNQNNPYAPANYQQSNNVAPSGSSGQSISGPSSLPTTPDVKSKVVQGLLYKNDSDDNRDDYLNNNQNSRRNINDQAVTSPLNPNAQIRPSKTSPNKKNGEAGIAARATGPRTASPSLFGRFSNGGGKSGVHKAQKASPGAAEQAVKKMWKGYHSTSGSRGGRKASRYSRLNNGNRGQRGLASAVPDARGLKDPKSILEAKLRNRWNRGLASVSSGFSDKNVFLFSSMCQHYQSYAQENGINNGKTKCPNKP